MMPPSNQSPPQQAVAYAYPTHPTVEEEVDLLELFRVLVREKWIILFFICLCTAGAVFKAKTDIPIYRVEALLAPVTEENQKSSGLLAQYGGLAAMAGVNIGGGSNSKDTALARLQSRVFIEEFLRDENLLPTLFHKLWDPASQSWKVDNPKQIPTMWSAVECFKGILTVTEEKKNGLITLAIEWEDREQASRWANLLVERINSYLRALAIQDTRKSMEYLNSELSKTSIIEIQQAIINLIENQIKKIMLTKVQTEFAFKIIDPAVVPPVDRFVKPKRRLMVVLGFILGSFLGVFAAFLRNFLRRQKNKESEPTKLDSGLSRKSK